MKETLQEIEYNGRLASIIVRAEHVFEDISFFTPDNEPLQVGGMVRAAGSSVPPHVHLCSRRQIKETHEVLFVLKGEARLTLYDRKTSHPFFSTTLKDGDTALLMREGHGLQFLEETKILEVKQGPYPGVQAAKLQLTS